VELTQLAPWLYEVVVNPKTPVLAPLEE